MEKSNDTNTPMTKEVRIKDAFKEDSGRGIVRVDPEVIESLKLKSGDIVEIRHLMSNRKTAAILKTGKQEDIGTNK
ncbi:MAG: hypothetical protein P8Y97_23510 [Candidatus Lokiarchaeota archaeon]